MHVGRLEASVEALWRMTQMGIAEAERTGMPAPIGSAVKLRYSELEPGDRRPDAAYDRAGP